MISLKNCTNLSNATLKKNKKKKTDNTYWGFLNGSSGIESACNPEGAGDMGSIPGLRRSPGGGHANPLQYSYQEDRSLGQRRLRGCSPWHCSESDTTEHTHTFIEQTAIFFLLRHDVLHFFICFL